MYFSSSEQFEESYIFRLIHLILITCTFNLFHANITLILHSIDWFLPEGNINMKNDLESWEFYPRFSDYFGGMEVSKLA